jgi:hypothetical protein
MAVPELVCLLRPAGRAGPAAGEPVDAAGVGAHLGLRRPSGVPEEGWMLLWLTRRPAGLFLALVLAVVALMVALDVRPPERPRPYEPPARCRLVPSQAGTWGAARCLHVPARHHPEGR